VIVSLSALFSWLEASGEIEHNPWRGVSSSVKVPTRGNRPKRRPWMPEELRSLLVEKLPATDVLWSMAAIAAYSGLRIEEIATLKKEETTDDAFRVVEGKTEAAVRFVPIHPAIARLVEQLKKHTGDEYLIPGLLRGGKDQLRSHYASKRFGLAIR